MILRTVRLCFAAGLLAAAWVAHAQPIPRPMLPIGRPSPNDAQSIIKPGREQMMNKYVIQGGDVDSVLQTLQLYTGRIVIHPTALPPGSYTINVDHPIPMSEFILALETQLFENGIAVIPMGKDFLKVVPLINAKSEAPEFIEGSTLGYPPSNRVATKLFQLRFLRANELFQGGPSGGFTAMLSNSMGNPVVVLDKSNSALVTDSISNLQRIELLVEKIDQPNLAGFTTQFYPLHNSKASDVASRLHALLTGPIASHLGTSTTYNADDRTNQLIVITDPRELPFFDDLVSKLDMASAPNTRTEVIPLQHADATKLQTLLASVISGQVAAAQKASSSGPRPGELATVNPTTMGTAPGAAPIAASPAVAAALKQASATAFSEYASVVADERSNSVVVSGTADDVRLMRDLVDQLDQALAQVRIQVIIAQVSLNDSDISGISALNLTVGKAPNGGTSITSFSGAPGTSTTTGTPSSIAGWDFTNGIVNPLSFNAALNPTSAGEKTRVHVLSAPVIVTAHAQAADFTSTQQVPVINGIQNTLGATTAGSVQTETSQYINIGIDLNVTPLIGNNGDIQLQIDQKVDSIASYTSINGNPQPNIAHNEAKSYVTLKNDQMIVLGGMQETTKSSDQDKIGFIYQIPILTQLLGGHTDKLIRTELLFFIRPHIITLEEASADTQRRINEMSSNGEINQFLQDPKPKPDSKPKNFLDRFRTD
jgi:general secretion pathway protein D